MVAQLETIALDFGLNQLHTNVTHITICASEPTTYALATVGSTSLQLLGFNSFGASNAFGAPATSSTSLRAVSSAAVTAGTITTTGTAAWWAAVDETGSSLYAHGSLSASQVVTAGNTFSLASFNISIPQH
jgi:hypothetical protein